MNSMNVLARRGALLGVLALAVVMGCSDTRKRESGKNLREATDAARRQYNLALKLLGNPQTGKDVEADALPTEALSLLDLARKNLSQALTKNYEAIKADPEDVPKADAGMAKVTLGMIYQLQGKYHGWDYDRTVNQANGILFRMHRFVDHAQIQGSALQVSETCATLSEAAIRKNLDEAAKAKAEFDKQATSLQKQIQKQTDRVAQQEKVIETKSSQASTLRTEATLARGAQSEKKLLQALEIEKAIHKARSTIQQSNGMLIQLRSRRASVKIRQEESQAKITAMKEIRATRGTNAQEMQANIAEQKKELAATCESIASSMKELDALVVRAGQQGKDAQAALEQASQAFAAAVNLVDADKKAQTLAEQAHAQASEGAMYRSLLVFGGLLKNLTARLDGVWEILPDTQAARPASANVSTFLAGLAQTPEAAQGAYKKAVDLWEQSVRAAGARSWTFKRELVVGMLDYARVLDGAGNDSLAKEMREKARGHYDDIEDAAQKEGKSRTIVPLREYVQSETGA